MGMHSFARSGYIGGYGEVRQPEILNVSIAESAFDRMVKITTAEHRRHWIRQI